MISDNATAEVATTDIVLTGIAGENLFVIFVPKHII